MNKINESVSQKIPQLKSLQDVELYLNQIRKEIKVGSLSVQNIDFVPIFHSIQKIVNTHNLRSIVTEFTNSANLFHQKIEDIRSYISEIGGMEKFEENLKITPEKSLDNLMNSLLYPPFVVEDVNLESLFSAFTRLTTRKGWDLIEFPELGDTPEFEQDMEQFNFLIDDVHFEDELQKFAKHIQTKLPLKLTTLLSNASDEDTKNAHFIFCLYLIQRKILVYEKTTNELRKYEEEDK